jgi:carbon storage regulator
MLVLTRRVGESIVIANDVRITVVALGNGRVKIGIEAPHGIPVDRAEIHERKVAEAAAGGALVVDSTTESGLHNRITGVLPTTAPTARPELRKPR